jgi:muramidase (phage lysozyme)
MRCETGGTFDPTIENPRSTASGLFQFLDSTWRKARELVGAGQYARASHAPAPVQIAAAGAWLRATSWSQWECA